MTQKDKARIYDFIESCGTYEFVYYLLMMKIFDYKPKSMVDKVFRFKSILKKIYSKIEELFPLKNDRGYWFDVQKEWENKNIRIFTKSTEKDDMLQVMNDDIYKVVVEINQIARFGRILRTDDEGDIINMPQDTLPYYMKQSIGKYFKDLYDINSQAVLMNIYEKQNSNLNMVRKVVARGRHNNQKRKGVKTK